VVTPRTSRKAQVFGLAMVFILSATSLAVGISSLQTKGVAFAHCRVTGCGTNLALTVGSAIIALGSLVGLLGVCLRRDDKNHPHKD
jgi:hypothetical protein